MTRLYHLVAINERTGRKYYLTGYPMTHAECCIMKSKQSKPHNDVRIQLEDAMAYVNAEFDLHSPDTEASIDIPLDTLKETKMSKRVYHWTATDTQGTVGGTVEAYDQRNAMVHIITSTKGRELMQRHSLDASLLDDVPANYDVYTVVNIPGVSFVLLAV